MPIEAADGIDTRQRVVIGQGDHLEPRRGVGGNDLGRRQLTITEDRVQVQVRPPVGYLCQWSPILCGMPGVL